MIRQTALFGLLLAANLNVTPLLAADGEDGCAVKRQVLQEKIEAAQQSGNSREMDGLRRALGNVDAHCDDASLHEERLASVKEAREEVQEREKDLREAMGTGDQEKIAKRQAKLAEARAELQQAEAEASVDQ
jgi:multidrug resistance efflux pump